MLQQTTVAVVGPRWKSFLKRFPNVGALARASERDVLAEWSGLGYYARAKNLHRAAREIEKAGAFPGTEQDLRKLPGVGDYTAAAIASIAFGVPAAVVDGNVARVLCRLFALRIDPKSIKNARRLKNIAFSSLSKKSPGDFNQAMMELGATVCRPVKPRCPRCPLKNICKGRKSGDPEKYPSMIKRPVPRVIRLVAGLAFRKGRIVLVEDAHLVRGSGHLTVPLFEVRPAAKENDEEHHGSLLRREWKRAAGRGVAHVRPLGTLRHSVMNRRYLVSLYLLREFPVGLSPIGLSSSRLLVRLVRPADLALHARGGLLEKVVAAWRLARRPASRA
jgi:A/G-specific adenine glycosylase